MLLKPSMFGNSLSGMLLRAGLALGLMEYLLIAACRSRYLANPVSSTDADSGSCHCRGVAEFFRLLEIGRRWSINHPVLE